MAAWALQHPDTTDVWSRRGLLTSALFARCAYPSSARCGRRQCTVKMTLRLCLLSCTTPVTVCRVRMQNLPVCSTCGTEFKAGRGSAAKRKAAAAVGEGVSAA